MIQPTISGVAYDRANERVFISACPSPQFGARRFSCDLIDIRLNGQGALHYLRSGGQYGYTQPAVTSDGRHLFAARTPRNRRSGETDLGQELVRIDLTSDEEIVVQTANQYRYERLVSLGHAGILAIQGYRTSNHVRCRGDFCIDAARAVLMNDAGVYVLPGVETTGDVASVGISVIPIGAQSVWISAAFDEAAGDVVGGRHVRAWLFEASGLRLSEPAWNVSVMGRMFEQFATAHPDEMRWQWMQIYPSGGPVELRAFPHNPNTTGGIQQASLTDDGYGVRLTKRRDGRSIQLDIEIAHNQGVSPWESARRISVEYVPPPRSSER